MLIRDPISELNGGDSRVTRYVLKSIHRQCRNKCFAYMCDEEMFCLIVHPSPFLSSPNNLFSIPNLDWFCLLIVNLITLMDWRFFLSRSQTRMYIRCALRRITETFRSLLNRARNLHRFASHSLTGRWPPRDHSMETGALG